MKKPRKNLGVVILAAVLILVANCFDVTAKITSGLVAYWNFDLTSCITAFDSSTYDRDGTFVNGPVWPGGFFDSGLEFDGLIDYVDVDQFDNSGNALTTIAWFFADTFDNLPNQDERIIS